MTQPYPDEPSWWGWYEGEVANRYHRAGQPFPDNSAAFRWFSRCGYDIGAGMEKDAAAAKHLKGFEEALGLTPPQPEPGEHPDPLVGVLRLSDGGRAGLQDDSGKRMVWGVHAGDLLARLLHGDAAFVEGQCAAFASAGAHLVRTWSFLWGDWWGTPPRPGQAHPGVAGYWDAVRSLARIFRANKLRWLVSQGDLFRAGISEASRQAFMTELARVLNEEGGLALVAGVDAGNENASAGDPDAETMARTLDPFLASLRPALISSTSSDENDLNRYVSRVCTVVDSHHGRWHYTKAVERAWTAGYWDGKQRPYLVSSEPPGVGCQEFPGDNRVGHHVSATEVPSDWNDLEAMGCLAAAHFVSRQCYVYLSSPGVISDEPFTNYPALALTGKLARRLPSDVQSWKVFHGGTSNGANRVLGVPADDRARVEHAQSGIRFVLFVHGEPGTHHCPAINAFTGVHLNLRTLAETPVSWRAGETIPVTIQRGCLFIGEQR